MILWCGIQITKNHKWYLCRQILVHVTRTIAIHSFGIFKRSFQYTLSRRVKENTACIQEHLLAACRALWSLLIYLRVLLVLSLLPTWKNKQTNKQKTEADDNKWFVLALVVFSNIPNLRLCRLTLQQEKELCMSCHLRSAFLPMSSGALCGWGTRQHWGRQYRLLRWSGSLYSWTTAHQYALRVRQDESPWPVQIVAERSLSWKVRLSPSSIIPLTRFLFIPEPNSKLLSWLKAVNSLHTSLISLFFHFLSLFFILVFCLLFSLILCTAISHIL